LDEKLNGVKGIARDMLFSNFCDRLFPVLREKGLIETMYSSEHLDRWTDGIGFSLSLKRPYWEIDAPIISCAILDKDPLRYLEKYMSFQMDEMYLCFQISIFITAERDQTYRIKIADKNVKLFTDFWKVAIDELKSNMDIKTFAGTAFDLIPICDDLMSQLKTYIEKYIEKERN
jgi:hypothetical protein